MNTRTDNSLEAGLRFGVFGFLCFIWSTLGLVMWIAMLVRITVAFTGGVFVRIVQGADTRGCDHALTPVLHFWIDGYHRIATVRLPLPDATREPSPFRAGRFIAEALYSIAFILISLCAFPLLTLLATALASHIPVAVTTAVIAVLFAGLLVFIGYLVDDWAAKKNCKSALKSFFSGEHARVPQNNLNPMTPNLKTPNLIVRPRLTSRFHFPLHPLRSVP